MVEKLVWVRFNYFLILIEVENRIEFFEGRKIICFVNICDFCFIYSLVICFCLERLKDIFISSLGNYSEYF